MGSINDDIFHHVNIFEVAVFLDQVHCFLVVFVLLVLEFGWQRFYAHYHIFRQLFLLKLYVTNLFHLYIEKIGHNQALLIHFIGYK